MTDDSLLIHHDTEDMFYNVLFCPVEISPLTESGKLLVGGDRDRFIFCHLTKAFQKQCERFFCAESTSTRSTVEIIKRRGIIIVILPCIQSVNG